MGHLVDVITIAGSDTERILRVVAASQADHAVSYDPESPDSCPMCGIVGGNSHLHLGQWFHALCASALMDELPDSNNPLSWVRSDDA